MPSKRALVGAFIIGGFLLFAIGLFFIGSRQKVFSKNYELYCEFARLNGLENGATVQVSGMQAGEVRGIEVPRQPTGRFRVRFRIQQKFAPLVRTDSLASIETQGVVGNELLEVQKGTEKAPEAPADSTIPSREPVDFNVLMQQGAELVKTSRIAIDELRGSADSALKAIGGLASNANGLVASVQGDMKHITSSGVLIADNANEMLAGIQRGQGALGKLVADKGSEAAVDDSLRNVRQGSASLSEAATRMNKMVSDFEARDLLGRAEQTVENTRQMTQQLNGAVQKLVAKDEDGNDGPTDLRQTISNANRGFSDLAEDAEALKHNFFLRGFFKKRGFFDLNEMSPAQYRTSKFLSSHSAKRAWLAASGLFLRHPDGEENLSDTGRKDIDKAMSEFVSFLPNSPLMIEGYSEGGSASERFLLANRRAQLVREYVEQRFGVSPNLVGVMPMTESPPEDTGKGHWDGISLVLLRE